MIFMGKNKRSVRFLLQQQDIIISCWMDRQEQAKPCSPKLWCLFYRHSASRKASTLQSYTAWRALLTNWLSSSGHSVRHTITPAMQRLSAVVPYQNLAKLAWRIAVSYFWMNCQNTAI